MNTQSVDVTEQLQRFGLLATCQLKGWSGSFTPKKGTPLQEATALNTRGLAKQGSLVLIDSTDLAWVGRIRNKAGNKLKALGFTFPFLSNVFFTLLEDVEEIGNYMRDVVNPEFEAELATFLARYPSLKDAQLANFAQAFRDANGGVGADPAVMTMLSEQYPTAEKLRAKFALNHCMINWSSPQLGQVAQNELDAFQVQTRSFVNDLAYELRQKAVEACAAFRRSLDRKDGKVNENAIEKFRDFVTRFERNNIMQDEGMSNLIGRIKAQAFRVENWVTETTLKDAVKNELDQLIAIGSDEGEAAAVASQFIRRVGGDDESPREGTPEETEDVMGSSADFRRLDFTAELDSDVDVDTGEDPADTEMNDSNLPPLPIPTQNVPVGA